MLQRFLKTDNCFEYFEAPGQEKELPLLAGGVSWAPEPAAVRYNPLFAKFPPFSFLLNPTTRIRNSSVCPLSSVTKNPDPLLF